MEVNYKMASMMALVPDSLKADMKSFPWVNWSEVAREAFIKKIRRLDALEKFEKILEKSQFTEEDALELSRNVKNERLNQLKIRD